MPVPLLETQRVEIVVADLDVVERRFGIVVFHEKVLDAGFLGVREEISPVDGALTDISHASAEFNGLAHRSLVFARRRGILHPVFYVNERETAGIFVEIGERVTAGDADPAEIHFHGDEFGIRFGEKEIVREFAAERQSGIEFERVIVIAKLDASLLGGFAGFVKKIGGALPTAGFGALLFVNPGANNVAVADDFGGLESVRPLFFDEVVANVARRRSQAVLVENRAYVYRRMSEVSGEFDFLVTSGGDFGDGACEVGFHGVADGVELETDAVNGVRGRKATGGMYGQRT